MNFEIFQTVGECHFSMMSIIECETTMDHRLCTESAHGSTFDPSSTLCVRSVGSTFFVVLVQKG